MHTLIRTILIILAAFTAGQILPPDSTFLALLTSAMVIAALIDCGLFLWTGSGLLDHLSNPTK